jgi:hypothetical protein
MAINLVALFFQIIVHVIIISPVLWLAGRALVEQERSKFSHAVFIALIGTIAGDILGALINGALASLIILLIWLWLIKHFFECGWLKAFVIAIIALIIYLIITLVLFLIGLALFTVV